MIPAIQLSAHVLLELRGLGFWERDTKYDRRAGDKTFYFRNEVGSWRLNLYHVNVNHVNAAIHWDVERRIYDYPGSDRFKRWRRLASGPWTTDLAPIEKVLKADPRDLGILERWVSGRKKK